MSSQFDDKHGLTVFLEGMPNAVLAFRADCEGEVLYANSKAWEVFGCSTQEQFSQMASGGFYGLLSEADDARLHTFVQLLTAGKVDADNHMRYMIRQFDGSMRMVVDFGHLQSDPELGDVVVISYPPAFVQREQAEMQARDSVTGLAIMRQFWTRSRVALAELADDASAAKYSIIFFDIRGFKLFNLKYGTLAGDDVLRSVAALLKSTAAGDLISRLSDDHFVAMTNADDSIGIAQRVCDEFARRYGSDGLALQAGIYLFASRGDDPKDASDFARIACESIRKTDQSIAVFARSMTARLERLSYISQNIERAIEEGWIKVYFQPVVRTISNKICGVEALARWIDPELGFLSPADFIGELESSRKIYKLDLYVAEEICRRMHQGEVRGFPVVPVSFNLSRYDFVACDMLARIEAIVNKYHVSRDMLNVEITESMMVEDSEMIQHEVDRFRAAGYEVWMDDFGSGYSSLNVLKNSRFDEIKLDMAFLDHLDDRGKEIIVSIISMAKKIGIHTLAEGVETEDQLQFLRSIGCEKAQGYLVGRPCIMDDAISGCIERGYAVEGRDWRPYYDILGMVDFNTDRTLAISEYDGRNFNLLFANNALQDMLVGTGLGKFENIYESINAPTSPLTRQFRDFQSSLSVGDDFKEMHYVVRNQHLMLRGRLLYAYEDHILGQFEVINMSVAKEKSSIEQMDYAFRLMYVTYDSVYALDRKHDCVKPIVVGTLSNELERAGLPGASIAEAGALVASSIIHEDDREEFVQWSDFSTVFKRIESDEKGYLGGFFRTLTRNGAYMWMTHHLLYAGANGSVIYAIKPAPLSQPGLLQKLVPEEFRQRMGSGALFEQSLLESKAVNFFWKDKELHFLGANKKFLDTYGIADVSQIVGKTDEDMAWHIDDGPYHNDELDVVEKGLVIHDSPGKCIIKGAVHNIMASKEPVYEDGKIVGLRGYFVDLGEALERTGGVRGVVTMDHASGLMSALGIMSVAPDFIEGWELRGEDFVVMRVSIVLYRRVIDIFGNEVARHLLAKAGEVLLREGGGSTACARLFSGEFVLLAHYKSREDVDDLERRIAEGFSSIRRIDDHRMTVVPKIDKRFASEVDDIREVMGFSPAFFGDDD